MLRQNRTLSIALAVPLKYGPKTMLLRTET